MIHLSDGALARLRTLGDRPDFSATRYELFEAIVAFSPELQLAAGVLYINRLHAKIMPAGGVIWRPNEDTRYELLRGCGHCPQIEEADRVIELVLDWPRAFARAA